MKLILFLLTSILAINCAETETNKELELNYREKVSYIDSSKFNENIRHLLTQSETEQKIAVCLLFLYDEISHVKYCLNGEGTQINHLNKQVNTLENALEKLIK